MNKPLLVKFGLVLVFSGGVVPLFAQSKPQPPDSRPSKIICKEDGNLALEGSGTSKTEFTMVEILLKGVVVGTAKISEKQMPPKPIDYSKLIFSGPGCPTVATTYTIRATNKSGGTEVDTLTYTPPKP